jgi:C-terminal processing protease CtpA/Prc
VRQLADVFGLIKSDYVEPVEDKKLLTEAISGMVASLDPHSAYLDKKAYAELREGSQASSSASASRSARAKMATSRSWRRSKIRRPGAPASSRAT